jgi:hypothetical protein
VARNERVAYTHRLRVVTLAILLASSGCGLFASDSPRDARVGKGDDGEPVTQVEVQQDVQRFTSQFIDRVNQAAGPLTAKEVQPARREVAMRQTVLYLSSALDIASGPYPEINLVDMLVFLKLSGDALESHWNPTVFGDDGRDLLAAFRTSEEACWAMSDRLLAFEVQQTVRNLIVEWQAKHPGQYRVEAVRFNEFAERAGEVSAERQKQARGLMGQVRQATRTADEALLLAERGMFLANRMPFLIRLQARLGVYETTSDALARFDNAQVLIDQLPELRPLLDQSSQLIASAESAVRESEELAVAWHPYLEWLSARGADGGQPVSLNDTLASANQLTDTSLELVRELRDATPEHPGPLIANIEHRVDHVAQRALMYLVLLGFAWSVLFWGGYLVVKRIAG